MYNVHVLHAKTYILGGTNMQYFLDMFPQQTSSPGILTLFTAGHLADMKIAKKYTPRGLVLEHTVLHSHTEFVDDQPHSHSIRQNNCENESLHWSVILEGASIKLRRQYQMNL